jgi:cytochrome c oxidase assembly protein subunit 15
MAGKRAIFEEVGETARTTGAETARGGIDRPRGARRGIRLWLAALFVMIVAMIAVGGLTRLTDSGLSITEWKPLSGALPPMSAEAWAADFAKYQQTPEYQLQNNGMTLEQFKSIFWWEWGHRELGRTIGLVWFLGFAGFGLTRRIPRGWGGRLFWIGALIGIQGAVGWWMVSSGLKGTMLDVASYRLATHLALAFAILGFIAWYVLLLGRSEAALLQARRVRLAGLGRAGALLAGLALLQIVLGALVAGIDAGRGFTDWPLMGGQFLPPDPFPLSPLWRNFFEDAGLVQFLHRMSGYALVLFGLAAWARARRAPVTAVRQGFGLVAAMLVLQMTLGILTLMQGAPLGLSLIHQTGAVVLWVLVLRARLLALYPPTQSIRGAR